MRLPIREVRATEQASLRVYNRFINLRYDWREPSDNPFSLHVKTRPRHMSYAEGCRKRFSRLASSYVEYRELLNQMVQEDRGYAIFDMSADECYAVARDAREHQNTTFEPFLVSHMTDSQKKAFDKRKMCGGIAKDIAELRSRSYIGNRADIVIRMVIDSINEVSEAEGQERMEPSFIAPGLSVLYS